MEVCEGIVRARRGISIRLADECACFVWMWDESAPMEQEAPTFSGQGLSRTSRLNTSPY
jgi:hypothetical protein